MLPSRAACSRCTSQLRAQAARQPLAKMAFSSAADTTNPVRDAEHASRPHAQADRPRRHHNTSAQKPRQGGLRRRSGSTESSASAFEMFKQIVHTKGPEWANKPAVSSSSDTAVAAANPVSEIDLTFKMSNLIARRREPVRDRLTTFNEEIWPQLEHYGANMPPHIANLASTFIDNACKDAAQYGQADVALQLVRLATSMGVTGLHVPHSMALTICHVLSTAKNSSSYRGNLSQQLLEIWMHVSQMDRLKEAGQPTRFALPTAAEFRGDLNNAHNMRDSNYSASIKPQAFIELLFSQFEKTEARKLLDPLLATLAVLSDARLVRERVQREAAPLLDLAGIFASEYAEHTDAMPGALFKSTRFPFPASKSADLTAYVTTQWPTLVTFLTDPKQPWRAANAGNKSSLHKFHTRLRKAHMTRNRAGVQAAWAELYDAQSKSSKLRDALRADPEFVDFLVFAVCAMRLNAEFKSTLEMMAALRIPSTLKTYTSMLHGWRLCKDHVKIEKLWDQLVAANVPLDAPIWTERLSAVIAKGQVHECFTMLFGLQKRWEEAVAQGSTEASGAVQPRIEMINAVLKSILDIDPQAAHELLAWAHNHGIKPDISTHNIIIRKAFATGSGDVAWVMDMMAKAGVEPNQATFTILIDQVLAMSGDETPEQQVAVVNQVFADMARASMKPSSGVYSKALYAVATMPRSSDEAVAAVLAHLKHQNVRVNSYMVTILIERALSRNPTSFDPVHALLKEHGINELSRGDQTLWERVIRAAAMTGRADVAVDMFDKLDAAARPVTSLPCLKELLLALVQAGRTEDARRVVNVVLRDKLAADGQKVDAGETSATSDSRFWRHHFWHIANENKLLDYKTVPAGLKHFDPAFGTA